MTNNDSIFLETVGWTLECESPLEIRHAESRAFASGLAARYVLDALRAEAADVPESAPQIAVSTHRLVADLRETAGHIKALVATTRGSSDDERWKDVFDLVFSTRCAHRVRDCLEGLGLRFSYDDPDTSYEDDVCAYARALESRLTELAPLLDVLQEQ